MITFHSRQLDCARHARKNENAGTVNFASQIASSICTVAFTKHEKSDATIFKSRCSRTAVSYRFRGGQALPLSFVRFFTTRPWLVETLAESRETVAQRPRAISQEIRRDVSLNSAQFLDNCRAVPTAMQSDDQADGSQENS